MSDRPIQPDPAPEDLGLPQGEDPERPQDTDTVPVPQTESAVADVLPAADEQVAPSAQSWEWERVGTVRLKKALDEFLYPTETEDSAIRVNSKTGKKYKANLSPAAKEYKALVNPYQLQEYLKSDKQMILLRWLLKQPLESRQSYFRKKIRGERLEVLEAGIKTIEKEIARQEREIARKQDTSQDVTPLFEELGRLSLARMRAIKSLEMFMVRTKKPKEAQTPALIRALRKRLRVLTKNYVTKKMIRDKLELRRLNGWWGTYKGVKQYQKEKRRCTSPRTNTASTKPESKDQTEK